MAVWVIGGGGHAKVVVATLRAAGDTVAGVLDDDPDTHGRDILGIPVSGPADPRALRGRAVILAIGANETRKRVAERLEDVVEWHSVIHPRAWVHPSATLGAGTVVFAGAVVQPDARIGRHVIINTAASVDHDCTIGDYSHLAPGCHLGGDVRVGQGVLMGLGSGATPAARVGDWAVVGAGGMVVESVPERATAVGIPARPRTPRSGS